MDGKLGDGTRRETDAGGRAETKGRPLRSSDVGPRDPDLADQSWQDSSLAAIDGQVVVAIGADLVDIDRLREAMARQPGFAERVFSSEEREYCDRRRDPAERYAARFAAKEAVLKAIGTGLGGADFTDIEVIKEPNGKPELVITGRAAARAAELGIRRWLITMSHSDHLAQVFVAGLGEPAGGTGSEG